MSKPTVSQPISNEMDTIMNTLMKDTGFKVMATQLNRRGNKPTLDKWHDYTVEWYKNKNAILKYNKI